MDILIAENLKKYYEMGETTVKALDGVNLSIKQGEFLSIVGTSGSGKSTLLHMLGGLDIPTSGRIVVEGSDISKMSKDELTIYRRRKIGFVFQNYNLLPLLNVYENIVLPVQLTIMAIILTTFLISVILSLGMSYWDTISLRQVRMTGMDYDIELTEPREDQVDLIRSMDNVQYAGLAVKCAIGERYEDKQLEKLRLYWLDDICWTRQTMPALETYQGSYPARENEIMLSNSALTDMGITNPEIGMEIRLSYFLLKENAAQESDIKTFILSGWYKDYSGTCRGYVSEEFFKETGVKQTDFTQGTLKISLKNPLYSEEDIINMQNRIAISDRQIIEADYDTIANFCKICIGLFGMLLMVLIHKKNTLFR